jgi:hypothetical protein
MRGPWQTEGLVITLNLAVLGIQHYDLLQLAFKCTIGRHASMPVTSREVPTRAYVCLNLFYIPQQGYFRA